MKQVDSKLYKLKLKKKLSLNIRPNKSALSGAQLTSTCVTHACGIPCNTSCQCRLPM